jgi:phosphoglycerol transferase
VSAQIRSYNRISIYLAFFSLACVAILLERLWQRSERSKHGRRLMVCGLVAMVAFGTWDQYPRTLRPDFGHVSRQWHKDDRFVKQIEACQPPGGMVYQLPLVRYPESPAVLQHHAYFAMRFYLHSDTLRWSCGAVRGREADRWQMELAELPLDEQLDRLAEAGFTGIHIARPGYEDYGAAIEANLRERLNIEPIETEHGRDVFFSMENFLAARAMAKTQAARSQVAKRR